MKKIFSVLLVILLIAINFSSCDSFHEKNKDQIKILIPKIGKADCIVICYKTHTVMIDTGEEENIPEILAVLQQNKIQKIDALILSHFDKDHIGGAEYFIEKFQITSVYQSGFSSDRPEFSKYQKALSDSGYQPNIVQAPQSLDFEAFTLNILPPKSMQYSKNEDNNASLIVTMNTGEKNLLFCGDAMDQRIEEFLADKPGHFDFVKLPHHGQNMLCYSKFLKEIEPQYAIITCSEKNPADANVMSLLEKSKVKIYRTQFGNITVNIDQDINIYQ